jgi:hypothetical protein
MIDESLNMSARLSSGLDSMSAELLHATAISCLMTEEHGC